MTMNRRLPQGMRVKYHTGDGVMQEGTVLKADGLGYSILPLDGRRILVPAQNVRGSMAR